MIDSTPPKFIANAMYTTTEACRLLGIHRNSLRQYVQRALIHPLSDKISGRNLFEGRELTRFWFSRFQSA